MAPDYPGLGFSATPDRSAYAYTFDAHAEFLQHFVARLGLTRYVICCHDYGSQFGLRLAMSAPERVAGLSIQTATFMRRPTGRHSYRVGAAGRLYARTSRPRIPRDLPDAELHVLEDAGHWALETPLEEIAELTRDFLDKITIDR